MRWRGNRSSEHVEDRRGDVPETMGAMGGGALRFLPMLIKLLGVKGTLIVAIVAGGYGLLTGNLGNMLSLLTGAPVTQKTASRPVQQSAQEQELVEFISVMLADTEDTWRQIFSASGRTYQEPRLVLFRQSVKSACGTAQSAIGPFYCPGDQRIYIDLDFYTELSERFNAPGDFAQAYVLAHEVGHHIQTLLGISAKVHEAKKRLDSVKANQLSVRQELQADCFAGIWAHQAHHKRHMLEAGDLDEGLRAASAIGDDTLQKQARGYVTPDSFTHGSSAQRVKWFQKGFKTGNMSVCNTFKQPI